MRKRSMLFHVVILATALNAPAVAQQRPNFAGEWKATRNVSPADSIDVSKPGSYSEGVFDLKISQDRNQLTITRGRVTAVYALDGTPTQNYIFGKNGKVPRMSSAKWEGDRVTMHNSWNMKGDTFRETRSMRLDANGALIMESTTIFRGKINTYRYSFTRRPGGIT